MTTAILIVAMLAMCGLAHAYKVERDKAIAELETLRAATPDCLRDSATHLATLIATLERRKRASERVTLN